MMQSPVNRIGRLKTTRVRRARRGTSADAGRRRFDRRRRQRRV